MKDGMGGLINELADALYGRNLQPVVSPIASASIPDIPWLTVRPGNVIHAFVASNSLNSGPLNYYIDEQYSEVGGYTFVDVSAVRFFNDLQPDLRSYNNTNSNAAVLSSSGTTGALWNGFINSQFTMLLYGQFRRNGLVSTIYGPVEGSPTRVVGIDCQSDEISLFRQNGATTRSWTQPHVWSGVNDLAACTCVVSGGTTTCELFAGGASLGTDVDASLTFTFANPQFRIEARQTRIFGGGIYNAVLNLSEIQTWKAYFDYIAA